jgi:hypothetical protein
MSSGVADARLTSSVVTDPVVPHETAASAMRPRPRRRAGLDAADMGRDHA